MEDRMVKATSRYRELQESIESKQGELEELQAGTFGTDSEDTEERAREFFSDASIDESSGRTEKMDDLRSQISSLEEERATVKEECLERFVDLQLPFEQIIEPGDETVEFPFSEEVPEEVIHAIEDILNENLSEGDVVINPNELVVKTDDVEEAIEKAEARIAELRSNAGTKVDIDEYLEALLERDKKVTLTLYILNKDEPLTKKEIESRMGVEPGTLRGQLYYVLDNDPYLKKQGEEFSLTETGREVIQGYLEEYGEPEGIEQIEEVSQ